MVVVGEALPPCTPSAGQGGGYAAALQKASESSIRVRGAWTGSVQWCLWGQAALCFWLASRQKAGVRVARCTRSPYAQHPGPGAHVSAQDAALLEREPARPERPRDHRAVELDWQVAGHVELAHASAASACGETDAHG